MGDFIHWAPDGALIGSCGVPGRTAASMTKPSCPDCRRLILAQVEALCIYDTHKSGGSLVSRDQIETSGELCRIT